MIGIRLFVLAAAIVCGVLTARATPLLAGPLCMISNATPLTFDAIFDERRPQDGRSSFTITCSRTQTTMISLLYSHRMKAAARGPDLVYDLFARPDRSSIWGSGGDGASVTQIFPAGRPTTVYVYARIPAHQHSVAGQFNDSIGILTTP